MLATAAPRAAFVPAKVATRRSVVVQAVAGPSGAASAAEQGCPLVEECFNRQAKSSCVHPGRPLSQACGDCPRKAKKAVAMGKTKCIHPQRPLSAACKDCPRLSK